MHRLSSIILLLLSVGVAYAQTESPHGPELGVNCGDCHNPGGWTEINETMAFNHDTTNFPLTGAHDQVDCKSCHQSLVFSEASLDCASCHTDIHSNSVGNDCARCHTPQTWLVDFIPELHEQHGFPLAGSHSNLSCVDCHMSEINLRFDRLGNECMNCHLEDYMATTAPNHTEVGFSTNCVDCHDPLGIAWSTNAINHDFFPLTGGHNIQDCRVCHQSEVYSDISADCVSCHLDDYTATSNPNHSDPNVNFSTDCMGCHSINAWSPATYDHSNYPLVGAHAQIANDCVRCHEGNFVNTPNTCVGCHQDDYDNANNPDHRTAQFPTDCEQCHNENGWSPSTFDHDGLYFPIYSGNHQGVWTLCSECHINPNNFSVFSCIDCHEHSNKNQVDDDHNDVNGYVYESNACYNCHPRGEE